MILAIGLSEDVSKHGQLHVVALSRTCPKNLIKFVPPDKVSLPLNIVACIRWQMHAIASNGAQNEKLAPVQNWSLYGRSGPTCEGVPRTQRCHSYQTTGGEDTNPAHHNTNRVSSITTCACQMHSFESRKSTIQSCL